MVIEKIFIIYIYIINSMKKAIHIAFLIFLILSFASGIYFCSTHPSFYMEGFSESLNTHESSSNNNSSCPDLLIKSGNAILLYNSKLPESPGKNPIPFYNLDEYINYLDIQKRKGIHCPVLFLQEEVNTQGNSVFRIRPDIFQPQGGLATSQNIYNTTTPNISRTPIQVIDANQDNPPWNVGGYNEFDPYGQYIGQYTTVDAIHDATYKGKPLSENPMDDNWGGVLYTKDAVDAGKYKDDEVVPPSHSGPFVQKSDNIHDQVDSSKLSIFA
jgi:hypothetical protein